MEEISLNKCYYNEHSEQTATNFCFKCNKFLCETCSTSHCDLNPKHNLFSVDKDLNLNFTGYCTEGNHPNKLDYYCSTHNNLCCAACLCKIKDRGDGQHTECKVCHMDEIKEEKKRKLIDNIKLLKKFSLNIKKILKDARNIYERINPTKEDIVMNIKNLFHNFRILLDKREKELLDEVEEVYSKKFFNDKFIKESNKFSTKIKYNIDKGKNVLAKWDEAEKNGKIILLVNDCINIEKNLQELEEVKDKLAVINSKSKLQFNTRDNDIEIISEKIKNLGKVVCYNSKYIFKECPEDIDDRKKFKISGEKSNIIIKTGPNFVWTGTTCLTELKDYCEHRWKIKILKSESKQIMIGVAPIDFNLNQMDNSDFAKNIRGWYFYCYDLKLYSGPPHNYINKNSGINKLNDEIVIIMNMSKRSLKFIVNNIDKGEQYRNIPVDKPLYPVVCLFKPDTVEIIGL